MSKERPIVTALLLVVLGVWLLFPVHQAARFPGSALGTLLGVAAFAALLPGLAYSVVKRTGRGKSHAHGLLGLHVYAGLAAAFVAILHSGHRFDSVLGIAMTSALLLALLSGYAGRHFLGYVGDTLRARRARAQALMQQYDGLAGELVHAHSHRDPGHVRTRPLWWHALTPAGKENAVDQRAFALVEAIADTEYAIRDDERLQRRLRSWLWLHIISSLVLYSLLLLHIVAALRYGLRWLA
jgi:hypothetical protein